MSEGQSFAEEAEDNLCRKGEARQAERVDRRAGNISPSRARGSRWLIHSRPGPIVAIHASRREPFRQLTSGAAGRVSLGVRSVVNDFPMGQMTGCDSARPDMSAAVSE